MVNPIGILLLIAVGYAAITFLPEVLALNTYAYPAFKQGGGARGGGGRGGRAGGGGASRGGRPSGNFRPGGGRTGQRTFNVEATRPRPGITPRPRPQPRPIPRPVFRPGLPPRRRPFGFLPLPFLRRRFIGLGLNRNNIDLNECMQVVQENGGDPNCCFAAGPNIHDFEVENCISCGTPEPC